MSSVFLLEIRYNIHTVAVLKIVLLLSIHTMLQRSVTTVWATLILHLCAKAATGTVL